jgi:phage-related minor tail protein
MGALDLRALEHMDLVRQKQEEMLERVSGTIANLEESSRVAYEAMVQGQTAVVSEFTEKLGAVSAELESAFTASAQITQKAAEGVSDHLQKLVSAAESYQEATKNAEGEAVRLFGNKLDSMSAEVQKALSAAVQSVGADSNAIQQSTKATQEEAFKQFGEKLGSMSKAVETSVASSVQQAGQVIGGLESGIRSLSTVLEQLGAKQVVVQQVTKKGWFSRG